MNIHTKYNNSFYYLNVLKGTQDIFYFDLGSLRVCNIQERKVWLNTFQTKALHTQVHSECVIFILLHLNCCRTTCTGSEI